jgi:hypothetical protein
MYGYDKEFDNEKYATNDWINKFKYISSENNIDEYR